ncbi:MAG: hypothetical protein GY747_07390 [Planctomycetes bacterium]|nr:hypothetical protein [Planctomycetota bacterium]MCP4770342.1 hypothetical protein [Planctomycetota bacterium]MCP4861908.1 hypothetical protein [Planctomycetota bacterium]
MNKAQAKAQKKKVTILVIMALATAMTWGKNLFGKSDTSATERAAASVNAMPIPGAAGGAGPAPAGPLVRRITTGTTSTSITGYDQAVKRMEIWPNALQRRVHEGIIEEIVPFETEIEEGGLSETEVATETTPTTPVAEDLPPPQTTVEASIAFEDLRLKLTTTAIMGKSRYAKISGTKVTVGETIDVQVGSETIRYEVSAINPREVEIRYSGETHFLRISAPGLLNRMQEGA